MTMSTAQVRRVTVARITYIQTRSLLLSSSQKRTEERKGEEAALLLLL